jgi:CHAT domain
MQLNKTGNLKDYRYLLFSAYGYLAQNPVMSALVLSQTGNPPGIDGYITPNEWLLCDLNSDLTVLSACNTGVGKTQAGESVMGLPYALFVAGNKNTFLTLWPVDDEATAEFMSRFFTKLKAGNKQHVLLSLTKQEFQHPIWRNPKYWAAFLFMVRDFVGFQISLSFAATKPGRLFFPEYAIIKDLLNCSAKKNGSTNTLEIRGFHFVDLRNKLLANSMILLVKLADF